MANLIWPNKSYYMINIKNWTYHIVPISKMNKPSFTFSLISFVRVTPHAIVETNRGNHLFATLRAEKGKRLDSPWSPVLSSTENMTLLCVM